MTYRTGRRLFAMLLASALAAPALAQQMPDPPAEIADQVGLCKTCHGEDGHPTVEGAPILWGQELFYILVQLRDYRAKRRDHEIMSPIAAALTDDQMMALATYFSELPWPRIEATVSDADYATAKSAESAGQCSQCHLGDYKGDSRIPRSAGQLADYSEKTLLDLKYGRRKNAAAMASLMESFSDADIKALAHYLAAL